MQECCISSTQAIYMTIKHLYTPVSYAIEIWAQAVQSVIPVKYVYTIIN